MRKGNIVQLNEDNQRHQALVRQTTHEEREAWRASPASRGMNSAGETKLPPMIVTIAVTGEDLMIIEKTRCAPYVGWSKRPGMALVRIMNGENIGKTGFIRRDRLAVVQ